MSTELLSLENIDLTFGGTPLLENASLSVRAGERICLVGRNGSGKSTLMKIAAGLLEPDAGSRFLHPSARARYLSQEVDFSGYDTVLAFVEAGLGPTDPAYAASAILDELGLLPDLDPSRLSGGEARRASLASVLAPEPDILLLDEPTNHLDLPAIEWLEQRLTGLKSAIVLISHDRRLLETLSRKTIWLDRGRSRMLDRGFGEFEAWRDKLMADELAQRHKLDRKIEREERWMYAGGVTARRKRNMRRVAQLTELRTQRLEARRAVDTVRMTTPEATASGKLVIEATGLSKTFGDDPLVKDFSIKIMRGDRIGLLGPNGAGKTTLIRLLTAELAPDAGTVRHGANLELVVLDQARQTLAANQRVSDVLTGGRGDWVEVNGQRKHVASYLADFLFLPEQSQSPVKALSGGERARLLLARALAKPSNLLVLDEPTNDLDLETLDLLQELIADYAGTVLLVSHDRDFLDRCVTSVITVEGGGRWLEYAGGYSDMVRQRAGRPDPPPDRSLRPAHPQRSKTKSNAGSATVDGLTQEPAHVKRKLSFKDKHTLKQLPATIAKLEAEIASLSKTVTDPTLYATDQAAFVAASERLIAAQDKLAAAEEQWLRLEMLREELEG